MSLILILDGPSVYGVMGCFQGSLTPPPSPILTHHIGVVKHNSELLSFQQTSQLLILRCL